jgi:hypothetical protein
MAEYKPGNTVPESGLYNVNHDTSHAQRHQVTAVKGEPFPPCNAYGCHVTYTLATAALHLREHPHLKR